MSRLSFHLTSIFDHSIFTAFSCVVQRLIPQRAYIQQALEMLSNQSRFDTAFLFDVTSKIYIASSTSVQAKQLYELCSEAIGVLTEMSSVYGAEGGGVSGKQQSIDPEGNMVSAEEDSWFTSTMFNSGTHSIIHLSNGKVIYVKEITPSLSLVLVLLEADFTNVSLIDYNIAMFRNALLEIFKAGAASH